DRVWDLSTVAYVFHLVSNEGYQAFANYLAADFDTAQGWPRALSFIVQILLAVGLIDLVRTGLRRLRRHPAEAAPYLLPAFVVILPAALLIWHSRQVPVLVYYLLIGYPFHFLGIARGTLVVVRSASAVERWIGGRGWAGPRPAPQSGAALIGGGTQTIPEARDRHSRLVPLVAGLIGAILLVQVGLQFWLAQRFFAGIDEYRPSDDYGPPVRLIEQAAIEVTAVIDPDTLLIAVGAEERDRVLAAALPLRHPHTRPSHGTHGIISPADSSQSIAYFVEITDRTSAGRFFAREFPPAQTIRLAGSNYRYGVYRPSPDELLAAVRRAAPTPRSARYGEVAEIESIGLDPEIPGDGRAFLRLILRARPGFDRVDSPTLALRLEDPRGEVIAGRNLPLGIAGPLRDGDRAILWLGTDGQDRVAGPVRASLSVYSLVDGGPQTVPAESPDQPPGSPIRTSWTYPPPAPPPAPANPRADRFGPAITLAGMDRPEVPANSGPLTVTLHWAAGASPDRDYTAFVHLVDSAGGIVAQHDGPPAAGRWPTSLWRDGDRIADARPIALPANRRAEVAGLRVGLYNPENGERLGEAVAIDAPALGAGGGEP
ncbi:MAG TPA: hypothetical protein VHL09_08750, partial [Dehalococcoidia bacterium]|nr:hypothetical protein [Dehalococcoidia bacterium]